MTDRPTDYAKAGWDAETYRYDDPFLQQFKAGARTADDPFDGPEWQADRQADTKVVDELIAELQGTRRMLVVACVTLIGTVAGGLAALRWLV